MHTPCAEEPGPHNRQPCSLWVRRPARGWTGREGRKPTEERGCKYAISLVYVCLHPNMWGPSHMWSGCYRLFPTPFATSRSLLLLLLPWGETSTLGQPGPQRCPMAVPATLPPPPAQSFSSATGSATKLEKPLHVSESQFSPFRKSGHGLETMMVLGKGANAV